MGSRAGEPVIVSTVESYGTREMVKVYIIFPFQPPNSQVPRPVAERNQSSLWPAKFPVERRTHLIQRLEGMPATQTKGLDGFLWLKAGAS